MFKNYQGKRTASGLPKGLVAVLALVLVLTVAVGGTVAWLSKGTDPVVNTFTMGTVGPEINETFNGDTKSNVGVTNKGTVPVFVRVKLLFTWQTGAEPGGNGNPGKPGTIVGVPVTEKDITWKWGSNENWQKGTDGYFYYTVPLSGESPHLLDSVSVRETSENGKVYNLGLNILVDAVQATPADAAEETWGVIVRDGKITQDSTKADLTEIQSTTSPLY